MNVVKKDGIFEIYVNDLYLQTFNTAHFADSIAKPVTAIGAVSARMGCTLSDIKIYNMTL